MSRILHGGMISVTLLATVPAFAGPHCTVPLADWKPRETLQVKLQGEGWTITRIKTDDGCYKVYATNAAGQRMKAKFDPATLEMIKRERDD